MNGLTEMVKSWIREVEGKKESEEGDLILLDLDGSTVWKTKCLPDMFEGVEAFGEEFWRRWNEETIHARGYETAVELVKVLKEKGFRIVVVTVRGSEARKVTVKKLKEIGVYDYIDSIWFRPVTCERWYWAKEKNAGRKDWRNGKKWGSEEVKAYLIPIIEGRMNGKFVGAIEDENHDLMRSLGMVLFDATTWWTEV